MERSETEPLVDFHSPSLPSKQLLFDTLNHSRLINDDGTHRVLKKVTHCAGDCIRCRVPVALQCPQIQVHMKVMCQVLNTLGFLWFLSTLV